MDATAERTDPVDGSPNVDGPRADPGFPTTLGRSDVHVSRLGVGAMTWGDPSGRARCTRPSWPTAAPTRRRGGASGAARRAWRPA